MSIWHFIGVLALVAMGLYFKQHAQNPREEQAGNMLYLISLAIFGIMVAIQMWTGILWGLYWLLTIGAS